ncbi:MAG: arginine deiminase-related protein [Candidatus Saccharimonadales bacterium]
MPHINSVVLMSDAKHFSTSQPINPYYHQNNVDINAAIAEHNDLIRSLTDTGINIVTVPSPDKCQDGVYTANWALVRGDKAVLASLPNARKNEESYAAQILSNMGLDVIQIPQGLKFSGQGDALACGNLLFCGSGYRSDAAAQEFAANVLGYKRVQLQTIPQTDKNGEPIINNATGWPDSYFYDIDLALAIIKAPTESKKGLIAYCRDAFTPESQAKIDSIDSVDKIIVSFSEATEGFATNLVSTGETVIMTDKAPILAHELEKHGLKVITPKITEIAKGGGYIRCMTLTLS